MENITLKDYLHEAERRFVLEQLERHRFKIQETAETLGLSRQSLQYRMKKLGIRKTMR